MDNRSGQGDSVFDSLDRGVLFAALGGLLFNAVDQSPAGAALTIMASIIYAVMRNRIANLDDFELSPSIEAPPGVDLSRFTLVCQWLGSKQLFYGLLGDLVDPEIGRNGEQARRYLRDTLWPAIWIRIKERVMGLLWFDRSR